MLFTVYSGVFKQNVINFINFKELELSFLKYLNFKEAYLKMTWHIFLVECMIIYFDFGISFEIIRHKHHWTGNVGQFSHSVVDTPHKNTQERIRRSVKG